MSSTNHFFERTTSASEVLSSITTEPVEPFTVIHTLEVLLDNSLLNPDGQKVALYIIDQLTNQFTDQITPKREDQV